jgi:nucleoside-diphosphate-sugar epimerase
MIDILHAAAPDVVFHLASLFVVEHRPEDIDPLVRSNLLFPLQLIEAMTIVGARCLVNTGTSWQHYQAAAYRPVNLYAATKRAFEDLLAYYHQARDLSTITLKLFDTYGPGDPRRKLIWILVDAALRGEPLAMSPGEQIVDLTHVDDVVHGFLIAASRLLDGDQPLCEKYLLSGERQTVKRLVQVVEEALGRSIDVSFGGRPYRDREVMVPVSPGADKCLPGWARSHSLAKDLKSMVK